MQLFPFMQYWWFYAGFTLFVLVLLSLDLGVFHRKAHAVSFRESAIWSGVWVSLALLFNAGLYYWARWQLPRDPRLMAIPGFDAAVAAKQVALEFLAGYVVEESLSIDNIFIFVLVMAYFRIPAKYQHRVLFYGILGAIVFRAIFIALGTALLRYHWVIWLFGGFLIITGIRMIFTDEQEVDPEHNFLVRLVRKVFPVTTVIESSHFFVFKEGKRYATPLFVCLVFLEATDIIFAVDSVPAIFALTKEPMIVFTSNIFAILGLRSLYFMLAGAVEKFHLLNYGLAAVLIFVGLKMVWLNDLFDGHFPISWSLAFIVVAIGSSIGASLLWPKKHKEMFDPNATPLEEPIEPEPEEE
jgi:tellurite resistance protein TerC